MCQIYCHICKEPIEDDNQVIEIRYGFVERGDFTPEEIFYQHVGCSPLLNPTTEDK